MEKFGLAFSSVCSIASFIAYSIYNKSSTNSEKIVKYFLKAKSLNPSELLNLDE